ncbi:MAG: transcriptional regulator [Firmicutes bacterium HGW-Firmicutes-15]|nr:MAG: transcriptional regulator [Firmicutes bacterium HGW-Firmicutes-15]
MQELIIGIDIGGSKILSGILNREGRILARKKETTLANCEAGEVLDGINVTVKELMQELGAQRNNILGVAVGAPGPLDYFNGIIKDPPNLGWRELPLREELSKRLGMQLLLDNDANMAALGELRFGRSKACTHLIYMTVSTGIGGGIIIDGKIYRGKDGGAGELGRMRLLAEDGQGASKHGQNLESLASGTALAHEAQELIKQGRGQGILALCPEASKITAREIGEAARGGDPEARQMLRRAGYFLGMAIANLVNIFNPEWIVLGGGAGLGLQDFLGEPIRDVVNDWVAPSLKHNLKIEFTSLGEEIGLLGCAAAVLQEFENSARRSNKEGMEAQ